MLTIAIFLCFVFLSRWLTDSHVTESRQLVVDNFGSLAAAEQANEIEIVQTVASTSKSTSFQSAALAFPKPLMISTISDMKTPSLRESCSKYGIPWRNVKGKNRHLSCQEMREALQQRMTASFTLP